MNGGSVRILGFLVRMIEVSVRILTISVRKIDISVVIVHKETPTVNAAEAKRAASILVFKSCIAPPAYAWRVLLC